MPLMLPHNNLYCRPGNLVILYWESAKQVEARFARGGTVLSRPLHYLDKVEKGLCYFAPTRKNSLRSLGLSIIVRTDDLPDEFRHKVVQMYMDGWLRFNDRVIHPYYPDDDVTHSLL